MNKGQLIEAVSNRTQASKRDVELILNGITQEVVDQLAAGMKVVILGFGTFETRERSERQGRNPQTGELMKIAASTVPAFSAGKTLKDRVATGAAERAKPSKSKKGGKKLAGVA